MGLKGLLTFALSVSATTVCAQDVIVKHDGSTILSKVIKIGTTEVEYKKFTNQGGPTYSILKSDILAINYENGDKDTFADAKQPATSNNTANAGGGSTPFGVNPNLAEDNLKLVREFNSHTPVYQRDDMHKKSFPKTLCNRHQRRVHHRDTRAQGQLRIKEMVRQSTDIWTQCCGRAHVGP